MKKWIKAGVRADSAEARRVRGLRQLDAYRSKAVKDRADKEARVAWESGTIQPYAITVALDSRRLDGPGVDQACGVEEPTVDRWETGDEYPTWEQLLALAELTSYPVGFFGRTKATEGEFFWICGGEEGCRTVDSKAVTKFKPEAIRRVLG